MSGIDENLPLKQLDFGLGRIADGIVVCNEQGRILYANEAAHRALSASQEALLQFTVQDIFPDITSDIWRGYWQETFAQGSLRLDTNLRTQTDESFPVDLSISKFEHEDLQYSIVLMHVVSARSEAQDSMQSRKQAFQDITENSPSGIVRTRLEEAQRIGRIGNWELNLVTNVLTCSDEITRIFEFETKAASIGLEAFVERIHPEDRDRVKQAYAEALERRRPYDIEHRLLLSDGWIKHVHQRGEATLGADHSPQLLIGTVQDISQSKTLEMALRKREEEFRGLLDHSPDVIVRYDAFCRRVYINAAHARVVGRATLLGKTPVEDWAIPNGREEAIAFQARLQKILDTGKPDEWELAWQASDGSPICFLLRGMPEFDHDGKVIGVLTFARDISERKRLEAATTAREREFRALVESSPDFITRFDRECRRTYLNPSLSRVLGEYSVLGKKPTEYYPGHPPAMEYEAVLRHVITHGEERGFLFHFYAQDRQLRCADLRIVPEYDSRGEIQGALAIGRDDTDRLRMEEALAIREREFRALAENSPDPIIRYDRNCRRIYVNPAAERLQDKAKAVLLNNTPEDGAILAPHSIPELMRCLQEVLSTGHSLETEVECITASGMTRHLHNRFAPEWDSNGQVASVLSICRDITKRKRREAQEHIQLQIFERLSHGGDLHEILALVAKHIETSRPDFLCSILLLDTSGERLLMGAAPSLSPDYNAAINSISIGDGVGSCGTAAWRGEMVIVEDIATHPYWINYKYLALSHNLQACWSEPIMDGNGKVLGVFAIYRRTPGSPTEEEMGLIRQTSHLAAIAIERKHIEEKIKHQASYDTLTGLPNRRMFGNRLQEETAKADRQGSQLALLFIDLDHFKEVNDTLGHETGDQLLTEAAQRIRGCVRESDTVARLGGDEFVVVLPDITEAAHLGRIAQAIIDAMAQPFLLGTHTAYVSASIGIANYPSDADNVEKLIGCADQAMYAAKEQGRNCFSFFTRTMQDQAQQRLQLATDLRDALAQGQLQVYYQPIVEIVTGRVLKAEALLRWQHPRHGWVSPEQFIPIAEETGTIYKISDWVLQEAAAIANEWNWMSQRGGEQTNQRQISINISPRQFSRGAFDEAWIDYLETMGMDPRCLTIEITEGLLLADKAEVMHKLQRLHDAGFEVALDDFGTGYSAMAYLKKFNVDYLKIDRSFVRDLETDPNDRAIAEAIVVMAHRLGLKVIAEGVETEGQRDMLAAVGCDYVQGYLYAKPMPAKAFLAYVAQSQVDSPLSAVT